MWRVGLEVGPLWSIPVLVVERGGRKEFGVFWSWVVWSGWAAHAHTSVRGSMNNTEHRWTRLEGKERLLTQEPVQDVWLKSFWAGRAGCMFEIQKQCDRKTQLNKDNVCAIIANNKTLSFPETLLDRKPGKNLWVQDSKRVWGCLKKKKNLSWL